MTDLERLEQELQSIRLTPSKTTDERILADAARALAPRRGIGDTSPAVEGLGARPHLRWRALIAAGVAALLLLVASLVFQLGRGGDGAVEVSAFSLLSQAFAAEEPLFAGEGIVSIVTEIIVKPVSDPDLARLRWHHVVSIEASGKPRFHQLSLPAEPGEQYTVHDGTWYDPATGRFVRLLTAGEKPIFANSYDGRSVYSLETDEKGALQIVQSAVTEDFRPPESPAWFLGMSAGLSDLLKRKDEGCSNQY